LQYVVASAKVAVGFCLSFKKSFHGLALLPPCYELIFFRQKISIFRKLKELNQLIASN
jgi:hypothetical protein